MDAFPAEIIHLIVERAQECSLLPTAQDWSARATTIRSLAPVAPRWSASAQHWLNADVWLTSDVQARRFLASPSTRLDIVRSLRLDDVEQEQLYRLFDGATALTSLHVRQAGGTKTFPFEHALGRPSLSKLSALVLECPVSFTGSALPFALRVLDLGSCYKVIIPKIVTNLKLASDSLHVLELPPSAPGPLSTARKVLIQSTFLGSAFRLRVLRGLDTEDLKIKEVPKALKACHQLSSLDITTSAAPSEAVKKIATILCLLPDDLRDLSLTFDHPQIPFRALNDITHHFIRKRIQTLALTSNDSEEGGEGEFYAEERFRTEVSERGIELDAGCLE
ncbi:hypothetical protein BCR35DRAFT_353350 [Leucosporidium creatinivorum]|uniref:F-box domain-containing protein n=1 Tax=Leucosporidium creatinivorum TaxID=106004 RepID=A0A1Y2EYI6_9BASI|nr:hypothetical protein BCR35DRAFT_353350 [Leucosporidium creatinivorum]